MNKLKNEHYKLAASLICGNMMHLKADIIALEKGGIDYIHFDVMDGIFVPRYGLFPEIITQMRKFSSLPVDLHMMVEDVEPYIKIFVDAGLHLKEDIFIVHAESTKHISRILRKIHEYGIKTGIALNPGTSLSVLDYILDEIDLVMLMGINPGIVGHALIPESLKKIADLKKKLSVKPNIIIEIDGGVTFETVPKMIESGATMVVCGSKTIFNQSQSIEEMTRKLKKTIDKIF